MINRIQRIVRKAIKDYQIQSVVTEETLVAFLCVDIIRELNLMDSVPAPQSIKPVNKTKREEGSRHGTASPQT